MRDIRISRYVEAAKAMASGAYEVAVPADGTDEVGQLGRAINDLSGHLRRRFEELSKLRALTEQINAGLVLGDVLDHVYDSFQDVIPFDRIGFALVEENGKRARSIWARAAVPDLSIAVGYVAELEGSSLQTILESGRPRIMNDLEAYLEEHPESESTRLILAEGIQSNLTCPLIAMGHPVGFMFFSSRAKRTYADLHVGLFLRIAGQLSLIIEKGRLYQALLETKQELEQANRKLLRLASLDGLTGIPNRRAFDERLDMEWRRATRDGTPLALVLIDIDEFKRFNDAAGHLAGDDCLREVAGALSGTLKRAHDFVGRFGGEEFGAILASTDGPGAERVAELLREAIERCDVAHPDSSVAANVTVSLGVASLVPTRDTKPSHLLQSADAALYQAKRQGRNRVVAAPLPCPESSLP